MIFVDLPQYKNPVTKTQDIKDLQELLVQTVIDFIKERNLTDINEIGFTVDGLEHNAIEHGEWVPEMDSWLDVIGLQYDEGYKTRASIGCYG